MIDHQSGDTICTDCGLVLGDHCVDVTPEWRKFHDQNPREDRTRMGASLDPGVLTTCISKDNKKKNKNKDTVDGIAPPNNRLNNAMSDPQNSLKQATEYLDSMACWLDKHGLPDQVLYDAKVLYKKAVDKKICRGRKLEVMVAACLFLACQENHNSRTPNEIAKAANGPSRKEINKMVKVLEKELEIGCTATDAENLWRRYCSNLGMNSIRDKNAVEETLKNVKKFDIPRSPAPVVATVLYMIGLRISNGKTIEDVHQVTDVAIGTIRSTYKEIHPFASSIIPSWLS